MFEQLGQRADAVELYEETLEQSVAKLGLDHPLTLVTSNNLASQYIPTGQVSKAIALYEKFPHVGAAEYDLSRTEVFTAKNNLALAYTLAGQLDEGLSQWMALLEQCRLQLGAVHPRTLAVLYGCQSAALQAESFQSAEDCAANWIDRLLRSEAPDRRQLANARVSLAEALLGLKKVQRSAGADPARPQDRLN